MRGPGGGGSPLCAQRNPLPAAAGGAERRVARPRPDHGAPGDKIKLRPLEPEAADQQDYVVLRSCSEQVEDPALVATGGEVERKETRFWAWYVDAGELHELRSTVALPSLREEPGTRDAAWEAPQEPGSYTLQVVERDGRGGVAWAEWELLVATGGPD